MATKAQDVFDNPELLEAILLKLPLKDILLAQRVNSSFRDSIRSSDKLQRKLFYQADPEAQRNAKKKPVLNPWLENFTAFHEMFNRFVDIRERMANDSGCTAALGMGHRAHGETTGKWEIHLTRAPDRTYFPRRRKSRKRVPVPVFRGSSWRDMSISSPPCAIHYAIYDNEYGPTIPHFLGTSNEVKMGELWDHWWDEESLNELQYR